MGRLGCDSGAMHSLASGALRGQMAEPKQAVGKAAANADPAESARLRES